MIVKETDFGVEIRWGHLDCNGGCLECLRDLRKLNAVFDRHAPSFESLAKECDETIKNAKKICEQLDAIVHESCSQWTDERQARYDESFDRLREVCERNYTICVYDYTICVYDYTICVYDYPDDAKLHGCGYCV